MLLLMIASLIALTAYLLWRRATRWAGLILASLLSAVASALCLLAMALSGLTDSFGADGSPYIPAGQRTTGDFFFGIACALFALLAIILFIGGIKAAIAARRTQFPR